MQAFGQHIELRSGKAVFSEWLFRAADNARFYFEVLDGSADSAEVTIEVYHKTAETTGDGSATPSGSVAITYSDGKGHVEVLGLYELVRFRFTVTSGSWIRVRGLGACWFDTANYTAPPPP